MIASVRKILRNSSSDSIRSSGAARIEQCQTGRG